MNHSLYISLAKQSFSKFWLIAFATTLIYSFISAAVNSIAIGIILVGPLMYGYTVFTREIIDREKAELENLFCGFSRFVETMIAGLIYTILISFGTALLIVPGIIITLGLSMTFYIMAENPTISGVDALKASWEMTKGYKGDIFVFSLKFIGWGLLCLLTCGIGFYALQPYFTIAFWHYYRDLKLRQSPNSQNIF